MFNLKLKIAAFFMVLPFSLFGNVACGGGCLGCALIYPKIVASEAKISKAFDEAGEEISLKYSLLVLIPLEASKKLRKKLAQIKLETEALERDKVAVNLNIKKDLEFIRKIQFTKMTVESNQKKEKE